MCSPCYTGIKQNSKLAGSGGKKKLCQDEASMGLGRYKFLVMSGGGKVPDQERES